jgi:hypothetical protein
MSHNPVFVQTGLLQAFGFLPTQSISQSNVATVRSIISAKIHLPFCFGIAVILSGVVCFGFQVAMTIQMVRFMPSTGFLVSIYSMLPYLTLFGRPVVILSLLLYQRYSSAWLVLPQAVRHFIRVSFSNEKVRHQLLRKWRRLSVCMFIATFLLQACWWAWTMQIAFAMRRPGTDEFTNDALFPLPVKLAHWQSQLIWSVVSIVDLTVCQQVLIILVILAHVLATSIRRLNMEIEEEANSLSSLIPSDVQIIKPDLQQKISQWKK